MTYNHSLIALTVFTSKFHQPVHDDLVLCSVMCKLLFEYCAPLSAVYVLLFPFQAHCFRVAFQATRRTRAAVRRDSAAMAHAVWSCWSRVTGWKINAVSWPPAPRWSCLALGTSRISSTCWPPPADTPTYGLACIWKVCILLDMRRTITTAAK